MKTQTILQKLLATCVVPSLAIWLSGCSSYGPKFDPYADSKDGGASPTVAQGEFESVRVDQKIPAEWLKPSNEPFRLGAGDQITIEVLGQANTSSTTFVTQDGKLYYQNVIGLPVRGKTLPELKQLLEHDLAAWYHAPEVSISLNDVQSHRAWVMGRVTTPGIYSLNRPTTLLEAISNAGGLALTPGGMVTPANNPNTANAGNNVEETADLSRAFFIRDGKFVPIDFEGLLREGQMGYNIYLKHGDYIYIPSNAGNEVYVLGAVVQPKVVRYKDQLSIVSAIASAAGPAANAHVQHIVLIRGSLNKPKVAIIAYKDIVTGKTRDIRLEPHDVIWVPRTPWERLDTLVSEIRTTFVRTFAVNEGAVFAIPNARPVGTSININATPSR